MDALKEWATVVKALENGEQTVILRKGGILETASGFNVEAKKFILFPTFEHQEVNHIKTSFHKYLIEVKANPPKNGTNSITCYAKVLDEADISSQEKINALSEFHIWSDSYIQERRNCSTLRKADCIHSPFLTERWSFSSILVFSFPFPVRIPDASGTRTKIPTSFLTALSNNSFPGVCSKML